MILSPNRFKTSLCWRKIFNRYHRKIGVSRNLTLSEGAAFHTGVAYGLATRDWIRAKELANEDFERLLTQVPLLPEQEYQIKDFKELIGVMIDEFAKAYGEDTYQVIQPECEFRVALPGSEHNCIWQHWIELRSAKDSLTDVTEIKHWDEPTPEAILSRRVITPHRTPDPSCRCWQPHTLIGFTDALIVKNQAFWLQDHKTTAISNDAWWGQWVLDWAMTAYIYGIWKSTGVQPHGFYINALVRPSEKQVASWNKRRKDPRTYQSVKDYVSFNREAFLRDSRDLQRFEEQAIQFGNEWEWRILTGNFSMKPSNFTCVAYNRRCDYHLMCETHDEDRGGLVAIEPREARGVQNTEEEVVI